METTIRSNHTLNISDQHFQNNLVVRLSQCCKFFMAQAAGESANVNKHPRVVTWSEKYKILIYMWLLSYWKTGLHNRTENYCIYYDMCVYSLWPSDTLWQHRSHGLSLAQVLACCLTAPGHYLNQCWLIISKVQWHSSKCNFTRDTSAMGHWK